MRFLVGIIGIPLGFIIIVYRERIKNFTGSIATFEQWFGTGGTYTGFLIIGFLIVIGSLMYAFGTLQDILYTIFGRFFPDQT